MRELINTVTVSFQSLTKDMDESTAAGASSAAVKRILLVINALILAIGNCGGPLISRLYFIRGGSRIWFSSWLQTAGWPVILIPLLFNYNRRRCRQTTKFFVIKLRTFLAAAAIGLFIGLSNYLSAYGVAKLPVSTSALLIATQLAFTAGFSFVIVRQRFTALSINSVILLTLGAVVLGIHASGDMPAGESNKEYYIGFFMTLGAAALCGLILPLVELICSNSKQTVTYALVLEIQLVLCFFATVFCNVGMLINDDFQAIPREAREYQLGELKYYSVVVCNAIVWQCFFLGAIGVIFYSSSLFSGILITVLLPVTEILSVILYHEKFQAEKGTSLFLCLLGFISYIYGEIKDKVEEEKEDQGDSYHNIGDDAPSSSSH